MFVLYIVLRQLITTLIYYHLPKPFNLITMDIPAIYDRLAKLAFKNRFGQLTTEEVVELEAIFQSSPGKKELFDELMNDKKTVEKLMLWDSFGEDASWAIVSAELDLPSSPKKLRWIRYVAAAVILLAVGVGFYFYQNKREQSPIVKNDTGDSTKRIAISDSIAVITNADGSTMVVSQSQQGLVGSITGNRVNKKDSVLIFPNINAAGATVKTLPGKQLQVLLIDGTRAWLYGNSELSFPDGFTESKRSVALKGESYFDVTKKGSIPFAVMAGKMKATVLGTRFFISAYDQRPVTTSLVAGKIELSVGNKSILLFPGEEATLAENRFSRSGKQKWSESKLEARKAGLFTLEGDIKTILEEVALNFNCKIVYTGVMPSRILKGQFPSNLTLDQLLKGISYITGVRLTLQENTIIAG